MIASLGRREDDRKEHGAYYTPMYLADTVVSQLWDSLTPEIKDKGHFSIQRVDQESSWCARSNGYANTGARSINLKRFDGPSLLAILRRIHGWDLNGGAVRVAVFSLYVALLEEIDPPDLRALIKNKKLLPELWDGTLKKRDFS